MIAARGIRAHDKIVKDFHDFVKRSTKCGRGGTPPAMPSWLHYLGQVTRAPTARRLKAAREHPGAAQARVLEETLRRGRGSAFFAERGLESVRTLAEWSRALPIQSSDDVQRDMQRVVAGERHRLFREDVLAWCTTSGTGGSTKFYPITASFRRQYLRTVASFLYFLAKDHPRAFDGDLLYLTGSAHEGIAVDGLPRASMSGFNNAAQPGFLQRRYAVPTLVSTLEDAEVKRYVSARCALVRDVTVGVSILPSGLAGLMSCIDEHRESLVRDVRDGTLRAPAPLPPALLPALAPFLAPDAARARALEAVFAGPLEGRRVWPRLRVLSCWKAAAAGTFLPALERYFPGVPIRDAVYSATEGWLNVPLSDDRPGGPLAVTSHVIELAGEGDDHVIPCEAAERGRRYRPILTTAGGLYRYDLGDVVEVTGFWGRIPEVVFVHKAGHAFNIAGEKLVEGHVLGAARQAGGAPYFALVPELDHSPPRYRLFVERADAVEFAVAFEAALESECWEYRDARMAGSLGPVVATALPRGSWERLRVAMTREGGHEAQIKPTHLSGHPRWRAALDEVAAG